MPEIRVIGGVFGTVAVLIAVAGLRRHRVGGVLRARDLATFVVGVGLLALAVFPRWFDHLAAFVGVHSLEGRRVAIVTVLGFVVLGWALFAAVGRIGRLQQDVGELAAALARRVPAAARLGEEPEGFVAVVVPAFDEADALPGVLRAVPREVAGRPVRVVVVSDGSTDATVEVAGRFADVVLDRPLRRGSGAAVRTGMAFALERGAEIVVTLDGDGQHDPGEIPALVAPLLRGEAELAQGVRRVNSAAVSGQRVRAVGVRFFSWVMGALVGVETNDPSNGFRAIRADACRRLSLTEDQFYVGELLVRSARERLRTVEVPVTVAPRSHGESKKPDAVAYGWGFAGGIVRAMFRSRSGR